MGLFRELLQLRRNGKELQRLAGVKSGIGGLRDAVSQANEILSGLEVQSAENHRLLTEGIVATGIVTALRDTGASIGEHPQVELDLRITIPGRPPYPVTYRRVVNRLEAPAFRPGSSRPVRVDPADPAKLLVL